MKCYHTKREIISELIVIMYNSCTSPDFYGEKEFYLGPVTHRLTSYIASW